MSHTTNTGLSLNDALEAYPGYHFRSPFTDYVIVKESGRETYAVLPKISCCCSRFFMGLCGSSNYYTKEQADKTMLATAIGSEPELSPIALGTLLVLKDKFGKAAAPFSRRADQLEAVMFTVPKLPPVSSVPSSTHTTPPGLSSHAASNGRSPATALRTIPE